MIECVSEASEARLAKASRAYSYLDELMKQAREELVAAIIEERREGAKIEDITARVPYRQTQVNRILEAAGLTEKRVAAKAPAQD